jgi:hypothetical protein
MSKVVEADHSNCDGGDLAMREYLASLTDPRAMKDVTCSYATLLVVAREIQPALVSSTHSHPPMKADGCLVQEEPMISAGSCPLRSVS